MNCFLIVYFASVWEARFACFPAEAFFFFYRSYILFIRLISIKFSNYFFKIKSHGTIHTFKNYFVIVFSVFSNKQYSNGIFMFLPPSF